MKLSNNRVGLNIANKIVIKPIIQITILFVIPLYTPDILQKIKRSVIIEKTVSNNIKKKLIIMMLSMMLSMMFSHTIFICLPQRFRIESN